MLAPPSVAASATSAVKTSMMITVRPTARSSGCFDAHLVDGFDLVRASRKPFVDAARRLIELGHDPTTVLVMRHAGSDTDCLTAQIGAAAKLTVKEDRGRPRLVPWEPISRRVEALVSAKAKRVARAALDHANESGPRPGAAVAIQLQSAPVPTRSRRKWSRPAGRAIGAATPEFERGAMSEPWTKRRPHQASD